jgi:hypothetical protein
MEEKFIGSIITTLASILVGFVIAEIKNKINKDSVYNESIKCLLRGSMVNTYFAYKEIGIMPYYCKQSWYYMYEAYKKLGGNSFIDDIKGEIDTIKVEK